MSGWKERLHAFDDIGPEPEVYRRAEQGPRHELPEGPSGKRRVVAGVVAFAVFGAAAVFAWQAFRPNDPHRPVKPIGRVASRIVLASLPGPGAPGQLYSMQEDGSDLTPISTTSDSYTSVSLSPDATKIAYARFDYDFGSGPSGPEGIYVADADGSNAVEIYRSHNSPMSLMQVAWSPAGDEIGFILRDIPEGQTSEADWTYRLWVMGVDGTDPHPVSDAQITSFSWSPNGEGFAVTQESANGIHFVDDIFLLSSDGALERLTSEGDVRKPIWSPDSRHILFEQGWSNEIRAMVMEADGSRARELSLPALYRNAEPLAWSADSFRFLVRASTDRECLLLQSDLAGTTHGLIAGTYQDRNPAASFEPPGPGDQPCVESASWVGGAASSPTVAVPTAEDIVAGNAPMGDVLASRLGLMMQANFKDATPCAYWVEVDGEAGYCIEDLPGNRFDLYAIAEALQGHRMTAEELQRVQEEFTSVKLLDGTYPITFVPADGWTTSSDAGGVVDPAVTWTSNENVATDGEATFPSESGLSPDGILVTVWQATGDPIEPDNGNFPSANLPLILPSEIQTSWEGYVEGTSRQQLLVAVDQRALQIEVYYGNIDPTDEQLAFAQEALSRLLVAPLKA